MLLNIIVFPQSAGKKYGGMVNIGKDKIIKNPILYTQSKILIFPLISDMFCDINIIQA